MKAQVASVSTWRRSSDGWKPKSKLPSAMPGGRFDSFNDTLTRRSSRAPVSRASSRSSTTCAGRLCLTASDSSSARAPAACASPSWVSFSRRLSTSACACPLAAFAGGGALVGVVIGSPPPARHTGPGALLHRLQHDLLQPPPHLAQRHRRRYPLVPGPLVMGRVEQQPLPAVPRVLGRHAA